MDQCTVFYLLQEPNAKLVHTLFVSLHMHVLR